MGSVRVVAPGDFLGGSPVGIKSPLLLGAHPADGVVLRHPVCHSPLVGVYSTPRSVVFARRGGRPRDLFQVPSLRGLRPAAE